jgi:hypothetical protein
MPRTRTARAASPIGVIVADTLAPSVAIPAKPTTLDRARLN